MPREEFERLWPLVHAKADLNGDGNVSKAELEELGAIFAPIRKWLNEADTDNDGIVTLSEWQGMFYSMLEKCGDPSPAVTEQIRVFVDGANAKKCSTGKGCDPITGACPRPGADGGLEEFGGFGN